MNAKSGFIWYTVSTGKMGISVDDVKMITDEKGVPLALGQSQMKNIVDQSENMSAKEMAVLMGVDESTINIVSELGEVVDERELAELNKMISQLFNSDTSQQIQDEADRHENHYKD